MLRAKSPIRTRPADAERAIGEADVGDLYRRHAAWLRGRLRRQLGPRLADGAEDLVQETYARAVTLERTALIRHPRALLLRIAGRLAIDHGRRMSRMAALSDEAAAQIPAPSEQEEELLLKQVILGLPPRLREAFVLSRLAGLSHQEIARELGVSVKTVEARMSKALALCTARLRTE